MFKRLLPFVLTLAASIALVSYYPSLRDGLSWHVQHELCQASAKGRLWEVKILLHVGANGDGWNTTYVPILFAAKHGQTETVSYLINQGVEINPLCKRGVTPVSLAIKNGHFETALLLINRGAKLNTVSEQETILSALETQGRMDFLDELMPATPPKESFPRCDSKVRLCGSN
jgi:Ankyrin repeats (3 copies)